MKKIIAFLLCISLLGCSMVFAEEEAASVKILNALNIGSFSDGSETVTRGEFVGAVSDVLNYTNRPMPVDGIFSDVTSTYKYSGAIYDAYSRGLISGYADGTFGTNSPILYEHAIKILVSALGYDNVAKSMGGYPSGYMTVAAQNKILSGVSKKSGDHLSAAEASKLIENTINAEALQQVLFGSGNAGFEVKDGETLLSVYAKIEKIQGILSDNGITSLVGNSAVGKGNVVIDGKKYACSQTFNDEYLGYNVSAYVTCSGDDEERVLYIAPSPSVKTLEIPANRILYSDAEFSAKNIVYEDVYGQVLNVSVDGVADFIYNGKAYLDLTVQDLHLNFGKLVLIDNNSDSVYDVVHVKASEIFIAAGTSVESKTVYKKSGVPLKLDGCKNISVYRDGEISEISQISEWDTVSAELSIDKTTVLLNVSSKKLSGVIESISRGDKTISVGGKYYHVIDDNIISKISLSNSYEFCLDENYNIAGIKSENQNDKYVGILIDAAIEKGLGGKPQIKIFSSLGNFDIFDISDNASIQGNTSLSDSGKINYIKSNMQYKLVSCKFDNSGMIKEIMVPYTGTPEDYQTEESLKTDYNEATKVYCYGSGTNKNFDGKVVPNPAVVVFLMPADKSELESYSVTDINYFTHSTLHLIEAYSIGPENGFSEYIIRMADQADEDDNFTIDDAPVVVSKVSTVLNENGQEVENVLGFGRNGEVKYTTKEPGLLSGISVKAGDIIQIKLDIQDKIVRARKLVDGTAVTLVNEVGTSYSSRMSLYDVYYRFDNLLGLTKQDLSKSFSPAVVEAGIIKQTLPVYVKVYEVDTKKNNQITVSDHNAALSYLNVGPERSRFFAYTRSGSEMFFVIYN